MSWRFENNKDVETIARSGLIALNAAFAAAITALAVYFLL